MKFQGDILNFCDFIQVFVFTTNHHLNYTPKWLSSRPVIINDDFLEEGECYINDDFLEEGECYG